MKFKFIVVMENTSEKEVYAALDHMGYKDDEVEIDFTEGDGRNNFAEMVCEGGDIFWSSNGTSHEYITWLEFEKFVRAQKSIDES